MPDPIEVIDSNVRFAASLATRLWILADLVACGSHVGARKHHVVGRCEPACARPAEVAYRGAVDCAEQLVDSDARLVEVPKVA